jgi:hypothetical protein
MFVMPGFQAWSGGPSPVIYSFNDGTRMKVAASGNILHQIAVLEKAYFGRINTGSGFKRVILLEKDMLEESRSDSNLTLITRTGEREINQPWSLNNQVGSIWLF